MPVNTKCLCGNCFRERPSPEGPCPACGYDAAAEKDSHPMALRPGSILNGRYITGRVLGQGGFGITYLALDYTLQIRSAVKEFFPEGIVERQPGTAGVRLTSWEARDSFMRGIQNFLDEARVLAKFQGNANIAGVRAFFEENQTAYFVMDYVDGTSLKSYIVQHGGRISWQEAANALIPVMDALEAAHLSGILHRDVTPDNIYLTRDGGVKLLDFGSAGYAAAARTGELEVLLKAGYAPIEQYGGGPQGPCTDVYSLAATFYAAITGFLPPDAEDRAERDCLVPPSAQGAAIPPEVEAALLRALAVAPEDRSQSVAELRTAVVRALAPQPDRFGPETVEDGTQDRNVSEDPDTGRGLDTGRGMDPGRVQEEPAATPVETPGQRPAARPWVKALAVSLAAVVLLAVGLVSWRSTAGGSGSGTSAPAYRGETGRQEGSVPAAAPVSAVTLYTDQSQAGEYARQCLEKLGLEVRICEVTAEDLAQALPEGGETACVVFTGSWDGGVPEGASVLRPGNWEEAFYVRGLSQEREALFLTLFEKATADIHVKDEEFLYSSSGELCGAYTGYMKDGDCDGWGVMRYADGRVYAGSWRESAWNGRGTVSWPDGDRLECDFVDSVTSGSGVYYWSDGSRYEGEFADNGINGRGVLYYPDGTSRSGVWEDGVLVG